LSTVASKNSTLTKYAIAPTGWGGEGGGARKHPL